MADMCRFTAWLSERERGALDQIADREGCSVNYLVRIAVRELIEQRLLHVTNDTPGEQIEARG